MQLFDPFKQSAKKCVFQTFPIFFPTYTEPTDKTVQVVSLLCHKHVYMYIYAIHSLFYFTQRSFPVSIIDDGTLTKKDVQILQKHFSITVFTRSQIEKKLSKIYSQYSHIKHYMTAQYTAIIKWKIGFMLLKLYRRYIFIDSDILFFNKPTEIIDWIDNNPSYCLNLEYDDRSRINKGNSDDNYLDIYHAYCECLKASYFPNINTLYNNGLLCVADKSLIRADKLNKIVGVMYKTYFDNQFGTDELMLSCLLTNKYSRSLPKRDYAIQLIGSRPLQLPKICKHYCWKAKLFFQLDAIKTAARTRLFSRSTFN